MLKFKKVKPELNRVVGDRKYFLMNKIEIVNYVLNAVEKGNFSEAEKYLTEDFSFSGPIPDPVGKQVWFDLHNKINKGLQNFSFNVSNLRESGNIVNGTVQVGGLHSRELPSLGPGWPAVPPSNKNVLNEKEDVAWKFKGDKISAMEVEKVPNGGVPGLLNKLGLKVPVI
jgi:hypothetical protein